MYDPGELDQRINIIRPVKSDDDMGGKFVDDPQIIADRLWAKVRPLSGKETARFEQVNATAMVTFVIRNRSDILHSDVIIWRGEPYNIRFIPPVSEREHFIALQAEKGVAV